MIGDFAGNSSWTAWEIRFGWLVGWSSKVLTFVDGQAMVSLPNRLDTCWNNRHGEIIACMSITWTGVAFSGHQQALKDSDDVFMTSKSISSFKIFSVDISNGFRTFRIASSLTPSKRSHSFTRFTHTGGFAQDSCTFKKDFRSNPGLSIALVVWTGGNICWLSLDAVGRKIWIG